MLSAVAQFCCKCVRCFDRFETEGLLFLAFFLAYGAWVGWGAGGCGGCGELARRRGDGEEGCSRPESLRTSGLRSNIQLEATYRIGMT